MRKMFGVPIPESPDDLKALEPEEFAGRVRRLPGFARGMVVRELRRWGPDLDQWRASRDQGDDAQRQQLEARLAQEMERWLGFAIPEPERAEAVAKLGRCQHALAEEGIV